MVQCCGSAQSERGLKGQLCNHVSSINHGFIPTKADLVPNEAKSSNQTFRVQKINGYMLSQHRIPASGRVRSQNKINLLIEVSSPFKNARGHNDSSLDIRFLASAVTSTPCVLTYRHRASACHHHRRPMSTISPVNSETRFSSRLPLSELSCVSCSPPLVAIVPRIQSIKSLSNRIARLRLISDLTPLSVQL